MEGALAFQHRNSAGAEYHLMICFAVQDAGGDDAVAAFQQGGEF